MFTYVLIEDADNKSLFEHIFESYRHSMFSISYGILHDAQEAEDVTAECLLKIARNIEKIASFPRKQQLDYIETIVKNRSIDEYRKRKRKREYSIDDHRDIADPKQSEESMISHIAYSELVDAIGKLSETHRNILKLRCLYQFSPQETAQILGISPNAVNQRLLKAKRKLEEVLGKEHSFDGKQ